MTNDITIRSGIDINSEEFINYHKYLKENNIRCFFLDSAVNNNSPVLTAPLLFDEKDYSDYKIDDISFIVNDNKIIGHMVYSLLKTRPTIPLGMGSKNHLDLEQVKRLNGRISFNKLEYFCNYNINIDDLIVYYLSDRIRGKLEYKGSLSIENKVHIKK